MIKTLILLSSLALISGCAIGPLVEIKLAEEGAKFVEKETQILEQANPSKNSETIL